MVHVAPPQHPTGEGGGTGKRPLTPLAFLASAVPPAASAVTPELAHAQEHDHDHGHDHQVVPSDPALRVKALESLLVETGLVDRAALDALVDTYEHKVGPRNCPGVVALAWSPSALMHDCCTRQS